MSMTNTTTGSGLVTTAGAFTPEDFGGLVDLAVKAKSVAARTATVFGTDRDKVTFPKWVSDPSVAWYKELATIATSDGATGEVSVDIYKTAGKGFEPASLLEWMVANDKKFADLKPGDAKGK